ncbi:MAG: hypothetical protein AB8C13_03475 [Phycisphaerales bacterium]
MEDFHDDQAPLTHNTANLAAYFSGLNAATMDREDDPSADNDGHVITGTIINRPDSESTIVPVRVRVGHGVAAQTASEMLRKMADMIDQNPEFLSEKPGAAIRRLPDGTNVKKQLTIEGMLAVAQTLSEEDRNKLFSMLDQIRVQIDDPKNDEPDDDTQDDPYYTPPSRG